VAVGAGAGAGVPEGVGVADGVPAAAGVPEGVGVAEGVAEGVGVPAGVGVGVDEPPPPQADRVKLSAMTQAVKCGVFVGWMEVCIVAILSVNS
jgi:hypothetical protein